jgi:hypothetical protein
MCTGSAVRGGISFMLANQAEEVHRIVGDLRLAREFGDAGGEPAASQHGSRRHPRPHRRKAKGPTKPPA